MENQPRKNTVYSDMIYRWVDKILAEGEGKFTMQELSDKSGLPLTCNMRRRVNHAVVAGLLDCQYEQTERGGYGLVFFRPGLEQGEIDSNE